MQDAQTGNPQEATPPAGLQRRRDAAPAQRAHPEPAKRLLANIGENVHSVGELSYFY